MLDILQNALGRVAVDVADLRAEQDAVLSIVMNNSEVQSVSDTDMSAVFARAVVKGGMATHCFATDRDAASELAYACGLATTASSHRREPTVWASVPAIVDDIRLSPQRHPATVPLSEKVDLLRHYDRVARQSEEIVQCELTYMELAKTKWFANTDGCRIRQEQLICFVTGRIVARRGSRMEDVRVAIGGTEDFSGLLGREEEFERKAGIALQLLTAPKAPSGVHTVLLDPIMSGLFIHESFGHFSEADLVVRNPQLLDKMKLGQRMASEILSVVDDPSIQGVPGHWVYDDEGVRGTETYLIREGILTGRMHNRETAARLGEPLSGNAVAESCRHVPLVRMSNIYVKPGNSSFEELLGGIRKGLYVCDSKGGQTMGDLYSFGAQYGYIIEDGKLGEMVSGINLSGNLFATLHAIRGVANDRRFREVGGCGKGDQINVKSGLGGPHMVIDGVTVG